MKLSDLVAVEDANGVARMDLAKTAALIAHLLMAAAFLRLQVASQDPFDLALWGTYGGLALVHDGYNRGTAMLKDRSDKRIAADSAAVPLTTLTTTTTTAQGPTP